MLAFDILLVEDNPDDAHLMLRVLRKTGLTTAIHWAQDGEEALEYLLNPSQVANRSTPFPRVIFLDLKMPKVNGLEVLARLRSLPQTRHLPIVILSSSREDKDVSDSYDLGANSFVVKPIDFQEFEQTVADLGRYWLELNLPPAMHAFPDPDHVIS